MLLLRMECSSRMGGPISGAPYGTRACFRFEVSISFRVIGLGFTIQGAGSTFGGSFSGLRSTQYQLGMAFGAGK